MRLRFAVSDAETFHRYAQVAWPTLDIRSHVLITDQQGTATEITAAVSTLAAAGPWDLFLLYVSGHGEIAGEDGWFCLVDAVPGRPSLDGEAIDRLLKMISADRVVVFVDCCHAEALMTSAAFFSQLGSGSSRLCIASARRNQKAWEDQTLRRSIFSEVLLRALSSDSRVADASGHVDVESGLIPHLRDQVPLLAAKNKGGQIQEPVSGGWAASGSSLPTVRSRSLGRPLTVAQTVRARVRRVLLSIAISGLLALSAVDLLVFHLAVTATGSIVVRPGLRMTFSVLPIHVIQEIDTGLTLGSLDPAADATFRDLAAGRLWGVSTHVDARGMRTWLASIERSLRAGIKASVRMLAAGESVRLDPDRHPPPLVETAFLARLTGQAITDVGQKLYTLEPGAPLVCNKEPASGLDFPVLKTAESVFAMDAAWTAVTARRDEGERRRLLVALVTRAAYRGFHQENVYDRTRELKAFAASIEALVAGWPQPNAIRSERSAPLEQMAGTWCSLYADIALALIGDPQVSRAAEGRLRGVFSTFDSQQHDRPSNEQAVATTGLAIVGRRRTLDKETIDAAVKMAERDAALLDAEILPARELLADVALTQPLPGGFVTQLLDAMARRDAVPFESFESVPAFKVLCRNARFLDASARAKVVQWAETHAPNVKTLSGGDDVHEGLGLLAAAGSVRGEFLALLDSQLSPASRFQPTALTYRGTWVIHARGDAAAVALGMAARKTELPSGVVSKLENVAMGRRDMPNRSEIVQGLATRRYQHVADDNLSASIAGRLAGAGRDDRRRDLEVEIASVWLAGAPVDVREEILEQLLKQWRLESGPEQRIALARVVGTASLPINMFPVLAAAGEGP